MSLPVDQQQKVFGLMGVIPRTSPRVQASEETMVPTWPHLVAREAVCFLALLGVLSLLALVFDAPLEGIANPAVTPNPAKAPWYFLGLQELLHYFHPLLAGILLPGIGVGVLILLPYLDRNPSVKPHDRKLGLAIFFGSMLVMGVLILIGIYFRGPGWHWVWPWAQH